MKHESTRSEQKLELGWAILGLNFEGAFVHLKGSKYTATSISTDARRWMVSY